VRRLARQLVWPRLIGGAWPPGQQHSLEQTGRDGTAVGGATVLVGEPPHDRQCPPARVIVVVGVFGSAVLALVPKKVDVGAD
jgi:hypothetical protein